MPTVSSSSSSASSKSTAPRQSSCSATLKPSDRLKSNSPPSSTSPRPGGFTATMTPTSRPNTTASLAPRSPTAPAWPYRRTRRHPHGWKALDDLAIFLDVQWVVHGHVHRTIDHVADGRLDPDAGDQAFSVTPHHCLALPFDPAHATRGSARVRPSVCSFFPACTSSSPTFSRRTGISSTSPSSLATSVRGRPPSAGLCVPQVSSANRCCSCRATTSFT